MEKMKGLVCRGPFNYTIEDVPKPEIKENHLLVKPLYVGVCMTEVNYYFGKGFCGGAPAPIGQLLGHEASAEVVEVGLGVEGWKVGDRMTIDPCYHCGECVTCGDGLLCMSPDAVPWVTGFAEYSLAHVNSCYKIPDEISDLAASSVETFAMATRGVRRLFHVGDNVVLFGFECNNIATLQWIHQTANKVIVVDPKKYRRDLAIKLGADMVIDPKITDVVQVIREVMPFGADLCYVSVEPYIDQVVENYMAQACASTRIMGTIAIYRNYGDEVLAHTNIYVPYYNEQTITWVGSYGSEAVRGGRDRGDYQITIDALAAKQLDGETYISKIVNFNDLKTKEDVAAMMDGMRDTEQKIHIKF